jgi:2-dehydropantoate 2-reductase
MMLGIIAGRPTEIDVINGAIPRVANEVALAAPVNEAVTAPVKAKSASRHRAPDPADSPRGRP